MTNLKASGGKFNNTVNEIMQHIRKPVFVDNAVHHALLSSQSDNKHKVTIENRNNATYNVFSEKRYELVEGEAAVQLTHVSVPGHSSKAAPFYESGVISSSSTLPTLMYSGENTSERLTLSTAETSTEGIKINMKNMKGRSLKDIGFKGSTVHLGDPIDVGLRTSDLAMRLGSDVSSTLTSVQIGSLRHSANTNEGRRKHTSKFLAEDFFGIPLISALKFTSRHDGNIIYFDRFANLMYTPFRFSSSNRFLDAAIRTGNEETNPSSHNENRISIKGVPLALNENASVVVDDAERQQGKFDTDIQETTTPIFDATVKTNAAAKRVARQILKANSLQQGSLRSSGHPDSWDLRPGKVVSYQGEKRLITESRHTLSSRLTDMNFVSVQKGIEGVLQGISKGMVSASAGDNPDIISQKTEKNLSLFSSLEIRTIPIITVRVVESLNSKFAIGKAAGRATIGKANTQKVIGMSKFSEVSMRGGE
tara:strand:+ start:6289 stop:7725 length:1437 start_codon:yes stop_codon:yes gene_type:complete